MKNLLKVLAPAAVAALALVSCNKESEKVQTSADGAVTIRVHALAQELSADNPETKTYIGTYQGTENTILWGTGEYMSLCVTSTAGENTENKWATSTDASADLFDGEPSALFEFSVSPQSASSYLYQGLYPASVASTSSNNDPTSYKVNLPTTQNATASSYDPAAYILVAEPKPFDQVESDWDASFRRATALNKITLKNVPSGVSINKVKITAAGQKLAGGRHFDLSTGESSDIYGNEATIEVKYATALSGTNVDVWFTSWGVDLVADNTLTIIAYTTNNKSYTKTITLTGDQKISFKEGYLNTLGAKMSGITPEDVATIANGDYLVLAKHNDTYFAMKGEANGTRVAYEDYTGSLVSYTGDAALVWTINASGSSYTFKNRGNYLGWTSGNTADLVAEADYDADKCLMSIADNGNGTFKVTNTNTPARYLAKNTSSAWFAFYESTGQYGDIVFVPATAIEAVATPTFSPAAGAVDSGTTVTISTATSGATIYYTTDGSTPTTSSTQGTSVTVDAAMTIKAIAVKEGMADSEVASAQYTINGTTDYSTLETSNVTLSTTGGTNAYTATVNGEDALKGGKSGGAGTVKITVPSGTTTLHLHAAGWDGETVVLGVTAPSGVTVSPSSLSLTSNSAISGSSTDYTLSDVADYYFSLTLSGVSADSELTFAATSGKRFVIWGVNAEAAVDNRAEAGMSWSAASASATIDDGDVVTFTAPTLTPGHATGITYNSTDTDVATINASGVVTIVGGGTTTIQAIFAGDDNYKPATAEYTLTVTDNRTPVVSYDFETVAELNTLVTDSADGTGIGNAVNYSGKLTNAVVSFVPDADNAIVKDATGSILVYKSGHGLLQGQTFSGDINVTAKRYYTTVEITALDASFTGSQTAVLPATMTLSQLEGNFSTYQNAYVKVEGLTITDRNAKNISVSDGTKTYLIYDNANTSTAAAGDVITAIGTVADHNGTNQIKVWASSDITITGSAPKAITFSQPASGGTFTVSVGGNNITSGTTVASGTTVTLTATAATDYTFGGWTVSGANVANASAATTTFEMSTSAVSISASFTSNNGGSYTITFGTGTGDGTAASTSTACSVIVSAGSSYLSGNLATATKVYYNGSAGLKMGTSTAAGVVKMNLANSVTPTSIVVSAKLYNSSKAATLKVNGSATQSVTADFSDLTFNITSEISYLQLESSKYIWIESITVNY